MITINQNKLNAALADQLRVKRDQLLEETDWLVRRHRDQVDSSSTTTLTADQFMRLLQYRQQLRDLTSQAGFPTNIVWPGIQG